MTKTGHTYMPDSYKKAQKEMRRQLREQWDIAPLDGPVSVGLTLRGEGRGDLDNIAGAFLDAAVGIVFKDDRVSNIPRMNVEWSKARKKDSIWIVCIRPLLDWDY